MIPARKPPPPVRKPLFWDVLAGLALIGVAALVVQNVYLNMAAQGVQPGFSFLWKEAGFDVSESLIPYQPSDSYARVVLTGLANTIFLAAVSLVLATVTGIAFGLLAVSPSPVGRALAAGYVELFRNLPKLLILLVFFVLAVNGLPPVREAISLGPIHLSNRSLYLPALEANAGLAQVAAAATVGVALAWIVRRWGRRRFEATGRQPTVWPLALALLIAPPAATALLADPPLLLSTPVLRGFDFQGGVRLSLQFGVMAAMLALYHGAQIAEVVRGGVEATSRGQWEAAAALGLTRRLTLRLVVIPQVVRMIIPPMNNQYVNLIKNTSISIAVGYSDLMSVTGTTINQTFRPLEMMLITMAIYLALCLAVTSLLNAWSDAIRRREER